MLESTFKLSEHGTTVRTEVLAGITTFLTMAYIMFVNPAILSATGMDQGAVFVATCLAAAIGSLIMGLYANYPIALAPGMGLNAYFTYGVVLGMGHSWQVALGAVFLSGVLFIILSLLPVREWVVNSIPIALKIAISAGIGLFLAIIGMKSAGLVVDHPATLVTLGDVTAPGVLLACAGFIAMVVLDHLKVPGAIILSILGVTLVGVDHRAGLLDEQGRLPRLKKALMADSVATVVGSGLGTSTTTSYIESAAGIRAGGRTGLTACVVAGLFLLGLFFSPLAGTIPAYATAPALVYVACLMARGLAELDWEDHTESAPGVIAAITMPLTFSIAHGIAFGFISYVAIKVLSNQAGKVSVAVYVIAAAFVLKFALIG